MNTFTAMIPRLAALSFVAIIACAAFSALLEDGRSVLSAVHAQDVSVAQADAKQPQFDGVTSCAACHEKPNAIYDRIGTTKFVKLTESDVWLNHDKHAKAVELIDPRNSPLGKQMCDKLKIADIHQAKQCLSCHANWQYDAKTDTWADRPQFHEFGVSCESCHGPASLWKGPHEKPDWRKLDPQAKAELGMVDVRNPVARAKQCMACHVGDASQGKVVTHEMYAAGHPPLPGVELQTFAAAMPPHWRHIEEKTEFQFREEFSEANPSATAGGKFHASRAALLSAIVAMQASLHLVGAQVEDAKRIPDFAAFDCYACHHELKTPAWRQQRQDVRTPGRPHPAVWPTTLIDAAFAYANVPIDGYQAALAKYQQAFDAQPFGDPRAVPPAREALKMELDKLLLAVEKIEADEAALQRAFDALASPAAATTLDYDAARQTAWTLKVLAEDLGVELDSQFAANLHLALPSQDKQIVNDLPTRMKALSDFDPASFRKQLQSLKK